MKPDPTPPEETQIEHVMRVLKEDAVEVDRDFLTRLQIESAQVFQDSSAHSDSDPQDDSEESSSPDVSPGLTENNNGNQPVINLAFRGLTAIVVATLAVGVFLTSWMTSEASLTWRDVITEINRSEALYVEVVQDGENSELWVSETGDARWEESPTRYRILNGSRLYRVDEDTNRYTADEVSETESTSASSLFTLLDWEEALSDESLLKQQPQETRRINGRNYHVFQLDIETKQHGQVELEALVNAQTRKLYSLEATTNQGGKPQTIGRVDVVAFNPLIKPEFFLLADSLTEDGRIGKVTDAQGIVTLKPQAFDRWTPINKQMLVRPKDWLRTDNRGANATTVALTDGTKLTLGPGTLVELVKPNEARLLRGELQVAPAKGKAFQLDTGDDKLREVTKKTILRRQEEKLTILKNTPPWLAGFEGTAVQESLGSLIAQVNGQDVPLTVGYHKVTVDIRDQIARTTIEESFVNHTDSQTEGVFYFPLPQDASISGFAMWIGNELVEADVVEKQRAREIYETILREKRDPGLLEWAGGNLFKARVFPIFANSEKRIKITYTQVLPMKGNSYKYNYALQSEMLQQNPLRELTLNVKVHSALPLEDVRCGTHEVRTQKTANSASVEFNAQNYTPTRDFEVVMEVGGRQGDVVVIPHQRGEDGYFLMQLMPPSEGGDWQRELLPNTAPLQLLLLADTSASLSESDREKQQEFIASLLSSLSPKDTFNLGMCDVDCEWTFNKPVPVTEENANKARQMLAERTSLGWTNLDRAFVSVLKQAKPGTHVVYVGDGIVTTQGVSTHNANPQQFVTRLDQLYGEGESTFHAVTVGNTYESVVLNGIARMGSGSVRHIGGEAKPPAIARELLNEIAQPGLRDLSIDFRGVKVARVYPEVLPNIPAGSQQIILGRYLPEGDNQQGEVIVTGTLNGKPVKYRTEIVLKEAEKGNSFIPRLWSRMHLDHLLMQGTTQAIREEIIGLSEEYNIMTPYTSLLVLESDEDRERFGVKRRFQMRDGERFFADGRDAANYELKQEQMKRAGNWRLAMRLRLLSELGQLGRQPFLLDAPLIFDEELEEAEAYSAFTGGGWSGGAGGGNSSINGIAVDGTTTYDVTLTLNNTREGRQKDGLDYSKFGTGPAFPGDPEPEPQAPREELGDKFLGGVSDKKDLDFANGFENLKELIQQNEFLAQTNSPLPGGMEGSPSLRKAAIDLAPGYFTRGELALGGRGLISKREEDYKRINTYHQYLGWINELFPTLTPPQTIAPKPAKTGWSKDVTALVESLSRVDSLQKLAGGLEIRKSADGYHGHDHQLNSRETHLTLYSPKSWLHRPLTQGEHNVIHWADTKQRGVFSVAFSLGRVRESVKLDLAPSILGLEDHSLDGFSGYGENYTATLEAAGENRTLLIFTHKETKTSQVRYLIDTQRKVLLKEEHFDKNGLNFTKTYSEFVELAGSLWATKIATTMKDGTKLREVKLSVKALSSEQFQQQMTTELKPRAQAILLDLPSRSVREAKQAILDGEATYTDHFVLIVKHTMRQQWKEVMEHLLAAEVLERGKPGLWWVRTAILQVSRRNEEARLRWLERAETISKDKSQNDRFLAHHAMEKLFTLATGAEQLEMLEKLKPIFERQAPHEEAMRTWMEYKIRALSISSRTAEEVALRKQLVNQYPHQVHLHTQYAQALTRMGDVDAAVKWLQQTIAENKTENKETLQYTIMNMLENDQRHDAMVEHLEEWLKDKPTNQSIYFRYLSSLIWNDELEKAEKLALQWLTESRVDRELEEWERMRVYGSISVLQGNGYNLYTNRILPKWIGPLDETARFFLTHEHHFDIAQQIIENDYFRKTKQGTALRRHLSEWLPKELATIDPSRAYNIARWIYHGTGLIVEQQYWNDLIDQMHQRWAKEKDLEKKHEVGKTLQSWIRQHQEAEQVIAFLREQLEAGGKEYHIYYRLELFDTLKAQPWTTEIEAETLAMLPTLSSEKAEGDRLRTLLVRLYNWTNRMVEARYEAGVEALEKVEDMKRTELAQKKAELRKQARRGVMESLKQAAADDKTALADWYKVEASYLQVRLGEKLSEVNELAWKELGDTPKKPLSDNELEKKKPDQLLSLYFEGLLRHRYFATVRNLAARSSATEAQVNRVLKYIDAGLAWEDNWSWKQLRYEMLIVLDRPDELQQDLRKWIREDEQTAPWRLTLAKLLAEVGQIPAAVKQLETVQEDTGLSPSDYAMLADWYLVLDEKEKREHARREQFRAFQEYQLTNFLNGKLRRWERSEGELPTEIDPDVFTVFDVIFNSSNNPHRGIYYLARFYRVSRDFRLLQSLPKAVIGQTAEKGYPFLWGLDDVLKEIRDEATADELLKVLEQVRVDAKTDVDRRALDLLEAIVERRGAEVENQPGPHIKAAVAALQRAFKREWSDGEPKLMAEFLSRLGSITQPELATEQLRGLEALYKQAEPGTLEHLQITRHYANVLWYYKQQDKSLALLEQALNAYRATLESGWPVWANEDLSAQIYHLRLINRFAEAERFLFKFGENPTNRGQIEWFHNQLDEVYLETLEDKGSVSLGEGKALYQALQKRFLDRLTNFPHNNERYNHNYKITRLYRTAHNRKIAGVADDLKAYAFNILPKETRKMRYNYHNAIEQVANVMRVINGDLLTIEFLIVSLENEPDRFEYSDDSAWNRLSYKLAELREGHPDIGELEPRLLKLTLAALRKELTLGTRHNSYIFHNNYNYFWKAKTADFERTAEEVLQEHHDSTEVVKRVATYFYSGLDRHDRAIAVLLEAHKKELLADEGVTQLVQYLQNRKRWGESIRLVQWLITRNEFDIHLRNRLLRAYSHTKQNQLLVETLDATDKLFHEEHYWTEEVAAALARVCLETRLDKRAVDYFREAIDTRERTAARRGIGDRTLSEYYLDLAIVYSRLDETKNAVDAAASAIVSWSKDDDNRSRALSRLQQVLRVSKQLDEYIATFEKEVEDSQQERPIIRKAIGQVLIKKKQYKEAVKHLQLAIEYEPYDQETQNALLTAYDAMNQKEEAIQQLLKMAQLQRREISLYEKLGERLQMQPEFQERVYTSIVEVLPNESESHTMLAEIRQQQGRWSESLTHWQAVATLRELEPTGLLKLTVAQLHEKQYDAARESLKKLKSQNWPERFKEELKQIRKLEDQLENAEK